MKIGHRAINLGLPMTEAIRKAAELGFDGITLMVRENWVEFDKVAEDGGKGIWDLVNGLGLEISALTGGFGSFSDPEKGDAARDRAKMCVETAAAMGIHLLTSHIGAVPEDLEGDQARAMRDRMAEVCQLAAEREVVIGVETGPEEAWLLRDFIQTLGSPELRVNYDPANLLMLGFDHVQGVYDLAQYIVHTHAKDGIRLPDGGHKQTPLGEGNVDIERWVGQLQEIGYDGWLCIERETGEDRLGDAERGLALLRSLIS